MLMIISRLTSKAQTTIPRAVRAALGVQPGEDLAYEIQDDVVLLTRATKGQAQDIPAFSEWDGDADRAGYAGL